MGAVLLRLGPRMQWPEPVALPLGSAGVPPELKVVGTPRTNPTVTSMVRTSNSRVQTRPGPAHMEDPARVPPPTMGEANRPNHPRPCGQFFLSYAHNTWRAVLELNPRI